MDDERIHRIKERVESFLRDYARSRPEYRYADVRLQWSETRWAVAEDGKPKGSGQDVGCSLGIRVLAGQTLQSPGYWGGVLPYETDDVVPRLQAGLDHAYERAVANARHKAEAAKRWKEWSGSLQNIPLAPVEVHRDTVPARYRIHPTSVPLQTIQQTTLEISKAVKDRSSQIRFNDVTAYTEAL
ncbi:MAG: hypothetical protein HZA19_05845, partial [Nitrospirae bacterium]|nr:hypothetical protein [Nitrospirota bacterium]